MDYEHVLSILTSIRDTLNPARQIRKDKILQSKILPFGSEMQKLENLNEAALDQLTEEAISARLRKKWTALDHRQKRERLVQFSKTFGKDAVNAETFLIAEYFEKKKIRPKDVDYDEANGCIRAIQCVNLGDEGFKVSRRPKVAISSHVIDSAEQDPDTTLATASKKQTIRRPKSNQTFAAIIKKLNHKR